MGDVDLLVLRRPEIGEAVVALLRVLVDGLISHGAAGEITTKNGCGAIAESSRETALLETLILQTRQLAGIIAGDETSVPRSPLDPSKSKAGDHLQSEESSDFSDALQRKMREAIDDGVSRHFQELEERLV